MSLCCFSRFVWLPVAAFVLSKSGPLWAGEKVLVAGDSLTKEYRSEFPALFPSNPAAWEARNWIEILDARRHDQFDLGIWSVYSDLRLTGHEFNWAKPGGTVREFRNFLRQTADAGAEIKASSGGEALWALFPAWRTTFANYTGQAQRVVIFFGGNDLALGNSDPETNPVVEGQPRQIDYESIYAGTFGEGSSPLRMQNSIRSNLKSVIEFFRNPRTFSDGSPRAPRFTGPMILCAVPHVGCTPKLQAEVGTDPVRTAVLTQMLEVLNKDIRDFAATKDVGFADTYAVTKAILDPAPFQIGGVTFYKQADEACRPRYLFSGDGFHPNTAVHAKVAQVVADAFLEKYPAMAPDQARLSDHEIITQVLGLPGDLGYVEWMTEAGLPVEQRGPLSDPDKDGIPNAMEYVLAGRNPAGQDAEAPFTAVSEPDPVGGGEVLTITWWPRFKENAYADLIPQVSSGLRDWHPLPLPQVINLPDGGCRVHLAITEGAALYFRLAAVRIL